MPNRIIRDCAKTSPTLAQLSDAAERLFWRLTTAADDFGRFQADPKVVKGECIPLLDWPTTKIRACLQMLADVRIVRLYSVSGRDYGEFYTWEKYQGKPRAHTSKHPAPPVESVDSQQMRADADRFPQMSSVSESVSENRNRNRDTRIGARARRGTKVLLPEDLVLTDALRAYAESKRIHDVATLWETFCDHHRAKGSEFADWDAAWRTWVRNEIKFRKPQPGVIV